MLGTLNSVGRGLGSVPFLETLNERISSAFRATVISLSQLEVRASFSLLGPPRGRWDRRKPCHNLLCISG